jgi:hypothetical protein
VVELETVSKKMSHGSYNKKNLLTHIFRIYKGSYCVAFLDWANSNVARSRVRAVHVLHTAARRDPEVVLNQQRWEAAIEQATLTLCRNMIL